MRFRGLALGLIACLGVSLLLAACEEPKPLPRFRVTFITTADEDTLAGVPVIADGQPVGTTDDKGELGVVMQGREGATVGVGAHCPEGHRQPDREPRLILRRFQGLDERAQQRGIEVTINCPPAVRTAAVVVRTGGKANLPIKVRGREVGRTDRSGIAHLAFQRAPSTSFRVEIDTTAFADLRPQNPSMLITVPDRDEIFRFDQNFREKERRRARRRRRRPTPMMGPVRLGGQR
jgi:hypothetical protein